MAKVKYIRTKNNKIIVFGDYFNHSDFRRFEPISAGFISIGIDDDQNPDCVCYGESVSLDLKSLEDDTMLAKRQIFGHDYY